MQPSSRNPAMCHVLPGFLRRFARSEDGSTTTVEMVLWFPLFLTLLGTAGDITMTMFEASRAWDVVRDHARRVAVGELTPSEAELSAEQAMPGYLTADATVNEVGERDIEFLFTMSPHSNFFGGFGAKAFGDINIRYVMRRETNSNTGGT